MAYVNGQWVPDSTATGPYGATHNGLSWDPSVKAYVSPTAPSATAATIAGNQQVPAQAAANTKILQNQAATSAPGYQSPSDSLAGLAALKQLNTQTNGVVPYTDPNSLVTSATPKGPTWTPDTTPVVIGSAAPRGPAWTPPPTTSVIDDPGARSRQAQEDFQQQVQQSQENARAQTASDVAAKATAAQTAQAIADLAERTREAELGQQQSAASLAEQQRQATANEAMATTKFNQEVADRKSALSALSSLSAGGIGGDGGAASTSTGGGSLQDAADTATMTAAKEQSGERLGASLQSLRGLMAGRGIGGSGIEAANTRGLVTANLQDQNNAALGVTQARAARANQVADRNFAAQQAANAQRIQALLSIYGSAY